MIAATAPAATGDTAAPSHDANSGVPAPVEPNPEAAEFVLRDAAAPERAEGEVCLLYTSPSPRDS